MKKFSRIATAGLGLVAALGLTACHPPHQQDSDMKTDNASTFTNRATSGSEAATSEASTTMATTAETTEDAAAGESEAAESSEEPALSAMADSPQFIDCAGVPEMEPAQVSLNCIENTDTLTDINWTSWTPEGASGTATRVTDGVATEGVSVELSEPMEGPQGVTFSTITVDGAVVTQ